MNTMANSKTFIHSFIHSVIILTAYNKARAVKCGGIELILKTMQAHNHDISIFYNMCDVLSRLIAGNCKHFFYTRWILFKSSF